VESEKADSDSLVAQRLVESLVFARSVSLPPGNVFADVQQISPAALAYLGDAVYELYVRSIYLTPPKRLRDYHVQVVARVRAESQALHLSRLQPYLTHAEQEILRWGRNAATNKPKRIGLKIYQQATSLETLIGYLYLTDPQRLFQLFDQLNLEIKATQQSIEGQTMPPQ